MTFSRAVANVFVVAVAAAAAVAAVVVAAAAAAAIPAAIPAAALDAILSGAAVPTAEIGLVPLGQRAHGHRRRTALLLQLSRGARWWLRAS